MSEKQDAQIPSGSDTQSAEPGAFVPATYQQSSRKFDATIGQSVVNGTAAQYSRSNEHYKSAPVQGSKGKKIAIAVIIIALVAAVVGLGVYVYKQTQKDTINADLHQMDKQELKAVDEQLTGQKSFDEPFTVLLLGSDARADDPDMGARTDTIILVRVDPTVNKISMVSIPRDTRIEIEGAGWQKFNAAYTYGGPSGTIAAVKDLTGVDIDHYAEINFEGLVGLVDAIGGIDVEVDEVIDDEDAGGHIDAGKQHLDGEHALILARSRAYVDGDYTRQLNQRKVIMAIINKALTAPATELSGLIKASTKFLKTDSGIDFDFIYDLADQIRHNNDYEVKIYTASLPSSTATIDEVSWVIADKAGVAAMMKLFNAGKNVSKGVSETSISEDIAAAKATGSGTSSENNEEGNYEEGAVGVSYYEGPEEEYYDEGAYDDSVAGGTDGDAGVDTQSVDEDEGYGDGEGAEDAETADEGAVDYEE